MQLIPLIMSHMLMHFHSSLQGDLSSSVEELLSMRFRQISKDTMVTNLYYCGTLEHPDRIDAILRNGFSDQGRLNLNRI